MQRTSFDFDVITGPAPDRERPKPAPKSSETTRQQPAKPGDEQGPLPGNSGAR